jgi:hypothetical protein
MSETFDPEAERRIVEARRKMREDMRTEVFEHLTEREQRLVREAAVSGFVSGMLHVNPHLRPQETPDDEIMVNRVIDNALAFPESYPLIGYILLDEADEQPTSEEQ